MQSMIKHLLKDCVKFMSTVSAGRLHKVSDQIVCTVHSLNEHGAVLIEKSIDMVSDQRLHEVY